MPPEKALVIQGEVSTASTAHSIQVDRLMEGDFQSKPFHGATSWVKCRSDPSTNLGYVHRRGKPAGVISTGDFKRGLRIQIDGEPFVILDVHVQTPSARGASSLSKIKVRNLKTGQVFDKTFRGGDKVDEPNVELRPVQFLYRDDDGFHFMDAQSYEQFALGDDDLAGAGGYLKEGVGGIRSVLFNGNVISIELPNTVVLEVVDTAPAVKGVTAQAQTKPATLETGLIIQVPSYLESGELVQVDTREARFVARAKRE